MGEQDMKQRELISAMVDGQLSSAEVDRAIDALESVDGGRSVWHCYHLVGDVMRGGVSHDVRRDAAFLLRLRDALVQEAGTRPVLEPAVAMIEPVTMAVDPLRSLAGRPSANAARFHWRWVAGVAVMAVAVSVGWMAVPGAQQGGVAPMLAQVPAPAPLAGTASAAAMAGAVVDQPAMIRDPKLDQWLAAHRQFGGASALQAPAGFVRNATFEGATR